MPRVKHIAPVRPKKRRRADVPFFDDVIPSQTPEEDQSTNFHEQRTTRRFLNENKLRRYEELTQWRFLPERRVDLKPGDCDAFLMGVLRGNWKKLAEQMWKFDEEIVRKFYANAWAERQDRNHRKTMVRGRWISYIPQPIDEFLGNPFPKQEEKCHYQRLCSRKKGFSNRKVTAALCMPGKGYQIAAFRKETRIRGDMRTLSQVWLTLMLANVVPIGHVSDINVAKNNLLFSMIQDDYTINVARIILDEIQRTMDWERIRGAERLGTLGFPALITWWCAENGIIVEPKLKIRTLTDKKFIDHHYTNPKKNPEQRNQVPNPPASPSEPTLEVVKKKLMQHILHLEDQHSAICRFMMQMY